MVGTGENVRVQSLGVDVSWCMTCPMLSFDHLLPALEFAAFAMQGQRPGDANDNLFALGAMPVLQYAPPQQNNALFVEGGVGAPRIAHPTLQ